MIIVFIATKLLLCYREVVATHIFHSLELFANIIIYGQKNIVTMIPHNLFCITCNKLKLFILLSVNPLCHFSFTPGFFYLPLIGVSFVSQVLE